MTQKELEAKFGKAIVRRIKARKYMGDDRDSWAVFEDGHPAFTGLNQNSVGYYKALVAEIIQKREKRNG
jgi:hypothetical protein